MEENKKTAKTFGKVVKLPKNTNVKNFMENVKIARDKYWYIISEKEVDTDGKEIHLVKYNKDEGVDANDFVAQVKAHYIASAPNEAVKEMFSKITVVGNEKFSVIKNIPNVMITDTITENNSTRNVEKTLVSKITSDLIKLLK